VVFELVGFGTVVVLVVVMVLVRREVVVVGAAALVVLEVGYTHVVIDVVTMAADTAGADGSRTKRCASMLAASFGFMFANYSEVVD